MSRSLPLVASAPPTIETHAPRLQSVSLPLLDRVLREQQQLTAVERFAQRHDAGTADTQVGHYQDLLPGRMPGPGQQFAFEVDLDRCSGCKACVTACHNLNGLDDGESFRRVGLLHGGVAQAPFQQTVTTACHHCLDPACMSGCPVNAYVKDDVTGIVKHLDDQCIGCQYCTLTCPYEVPQYNARLGIVRKCDMCSDRLAEGEAPACVRGCPNEAIAIRIVESQAVMEEAQAGALVPGAPPSGITAPTTAYKTERALPRNLLPADFYSVHPAHEHRPLVIMLVLTQLSVGAFCADQMVSWFAPGSALVLPRPIQTSLALLLGLIALGASTMHLGRPHYAFRALLGLRTSWLSREILAFGLFTGLASLDAAAVWLAYHPLGAAIAHLLTLTHRTADFAAHHDVGAFLALLTSLANRSLRALGVLVALSGLGGVWCSVMLYHRTKKLFWSAPRTGFKFFMTAAVLGFATATWAVAAGAILSGQQVLPAMTQLSRVVFALVLVKLGGELSLFFHLRDKQQGDLKRSALLLRGELSTWTGARLAAAGVGAILVPVTLLALAGHPDSRWPIAVAATLSLVLLLVGELLERATFFSAVSSPRMPGGLS